LLDFSGFDGKVPLDYEWKSIAVTTNGLDPKKYPDAVVFSHKLPGVEVPAGGDGYPKGVSRSIGFNANFNLSIWY